MSAHVCRDCGVSFMATGKRSVCSRQCQYSLIKKRSAIKRQRACIICERIFWVRSADRIGRTCSSECSREHIRRIQTGRKQSSETIEKRSKSLKEIRADPEVNARWTAAASEGLGRWLSDPENARAFSERSSAHMARLHQNPEFQKRRDERAARCMKENWERHREKFTAAAIERNARHKESGEGLWSEEAKHRRGEAAKWIMKKAQAALHAETDLDAKLSELIYRLRLEMPYDGPGEESDYLDYCAKIGRILMGHSEVRAICDPFMAEAIPRFAKEWHQKKMAA